MTIIKSVRRVAERIIRRERSNYPKTVAVSEANHESIEFIKSTQCRAIAEVGIYKGHTSIEFAKFLGGRGELHLFDYEDRVRDVAAKIRTMGFNNIRTFGSSYKLLDSYNWTLAGVLKENSQPSYDYIFLDGAHTWAIDAMTTYIADRLLTVGGYLDFDDYDWTLAGSPSLNPKIFPLTAKMYTSEQIEARQVKMIVDLIIRRDGRYREVVTNKIFQKIA